MLSIRLKWTILSFKWFLNEIEKTVNDINSLSLKCCLWVAPEILTPAIFVHSLTRSRVSWKTCSEKHSYSICLYTIQRGYQIVNWKYFKFRVKLISPQSTPVGTSAISQWKTSTLQWNSSKRIKLLLMKFNSILLSYKRNQIYSMSQTSQSCWLIWKICTPSAWITCENL